MRNQLLTQKQLRFIEEYLVDLNATQAAIRTGYSAKTAAAAGKRNLDNPKIWTEIQAAMEERSERTEIEQDRVLKEEAYIAFADIGQIFNGDSLISPDQLPEQVRRAISSVEVIETADKDGNLTTRYKYRFWDKGRSLERVSKHLGMYGDNAKPGGTVGPTGKLGTIETLEDCKVFLSGLMKQVGRNQINSQVAARLVSIVRATADCIKDSDLESRLTELEKYMDQDK